MWIRILIALLLMASTARATVIQTSADRDSIDNYNPTSVDTLDVLSGDTLVIYNNWNAGNSDTTVFLLFVHAGGEIEMHGGARVNVGALVVGDFTGSPTGAGGSFVMTADDTLGLWDISAHRTNSEFYVYGSGADVDINGAASNTQAVIYTVGGTAFSSISIYHTDAIFDAQYAKFYKLSHSTERGLAFVGAVRTDNTKQKIENCVFDSTNFYIFNMDDENIKNCTFLNYQDISFQPQFRIDGGEKDTLYNCIYTYDHENTASNGTADGFSINADSMWIISCTLTTVNVNTSNKEYRGDNAISLGANHYGTTINDTYIKDFFFGVNAAANHYKVLIDDNEMHDLSHEAIIATDNCSLWTIQANVFYAGIVDLSRSMITAYSTIGGLNDWKLYYNTIIVDTIILGLTAVGYDYPSLPSAKYTLSNHEYIGNIIIGVFNGTFDSAGVFVKDSIDVELDEFKYNSYKSIYVNTGASFTLSEYTIADSNRISSQHTFADSANNDYRLGVGSANLDYGDTTTCNVVFEIANDPCNCGYYQGAGIGAAAAPSARRRKILLGGK